MLWRSVIRYVAGGPAMHLRYRVDLEESERQQLEGIVASGTRAGPAREARRRTVGADRAYDVGDFVGLMRDLRARAAANVVRTRSFRGDASKAEAGGADRALCGLHESPIVEQLSQRRPDRTPLNISLGLDQQPRRLLRLQSRTSSLHRWHSILSWGSD